MKNFSFLILLLSNTAIANCIFSPSGEWTVNSSSSCTVNNANYPINNELKFLNIGVNHDTTFTISEDIIDIYINTTNYAQVINLLPGSYNNKVNIFPSMTIENNAARARADVLVDGNNNFVTFYKNLTLTGPGAGIQAMNGGEIDILGDYSSTITDAANSPLNRAVKSEHQNSLVTLNNIYAISESNQDKAGLILASNGRVIVKNNAELSISGKGNDKFIIKSVPGGNIIIKGLSIININDLNGNTDAIIAESGDISFDKDVTITFISPNKLSSTIKNSTYGTISFYENINSTGEETAINNNNAKINLFGSITDFKGYKSTIDPQDPTKTVPEYQAGGHILNTKGTINLSNYEPIKPIQGTLFGKLTIAGNYTGTDGVLQIDTKLDSDDLSKNNTDFITIGGKASGSTELKVINAGGSGVRTYNKGIHIIQTGSSDEGAFYIANKGHVTVGAYDYGLFLDSNNWYLRSHRNDGGTDEDLPVYTPDVGEYLAAETMGNTLFTSRLEDREGASQYQNLGNKNEGNVWVRAYGGHNKFKTMDGQLKTTGNSFVTQIGTGLVTLGEEDQYNLGAMTGFAYYNGKTRSNLTDRESKTKINGYSLGLYGTWYAHPVEKRGAYIDSWVLWNKFNNKIDTPDQNQYKYDSSGITASIEAGGDYLLNKNGKKDWWIQPQAQLIYQGVHADDFKDAQGVDINHGKDNIQARMGVKTYLNIPTNGNKLTSYRPYVALNFIHNTNPYSVVIDDIRYENEGSANLGELKLGVEGNVTKNSQVWLNASYVTGSHSNQAYQGNIGWKYNF